MTTPTREALLALATRLESEGPSRKLDVTIASHVGWYSREVGHRTQRQTPHFTSSLDAAVTLVLEGCQWSVAGYGFAAVHLPNKTCISAEGGKTPIMRLLGAIFRARAALQGESDHD